jgi:hypothetical protein
LGLINLVFACQMPSSQRSSSSSMPPSSPSGSSSGMPGSPSTPSFPSGSQSKSGNKSGSQSGGQSGSSSGGPTQPGSSGSGMPNSSTSTSGKSGSQGGTEGGSGESLEHLEQSLDESLGDFDDMILQESTGSSANGEGVDIFEPISQAGGGDGPLFEESPLSEGEMADAQSSGNSGSNSASSASASGAAGNAGGGAASPDTQEVELPADIDDGRGDDIVARQIREAAMAERDPALRDKLWEEYRKYENQ